MKQRLVAAAVAVTSIAAATGAFAQAARQDLAIRAIVPKFCTVGGSVTSINFTITIPVSDLGAVNTTVQSFTSPSAICNTAADVITTSMLGGAKNTRAVTVRSGFTNVVGYIATASFGGATSTINTAFVPTTTASERVSTASTSSAAKGNLVITVVPIQPIAPLMPGTSYTDNLRVTLQPK
jgi:hypothetical protein